MLKYQYKKYIAHAFWSSLLTVLNAFLAAFIAVYLWTILQGMATSKINEDQPLAAGGDRQLEELESLKSDSLAEDSEDGFVLQSLVNGGVQTSDEENIQLLNTLSTP